LLACKDLIETLLPFRCGRLRADRSVTSGGFPSSLQWRNATQECDR